MTVSVVPYSGTGRRGTVETPDPNANGNGNGNGCDCSAMTVGAMGRAADCFVAGTPQDGGTRSRGPMVLPVPVLALTASGSLASVGAGSGEGAVTVGCDC